jgi:hypothetical protein
VRVGELHAPHVVEILQGTLERGELLVAVQVPLIDTNAGKTEQPPGIDCDDVGNQFVTCDARRMRAINREDACRRNARAVELAQDMIGGQPHVGQDRHDPLEARRYSFRQAVTENRRRALPGAGMQMHVDHGQSLTVQHYAGFRIAATTGKQR